ncbi:MAG: tRNA pseudouridine(55) synthase TruB [Alphaproteobacteria bacterium]|nr:tRNA pseudouridine(55) synthase TruB [Alphaproteobacteria bacterium]
MKHSCGWLNIDKPKGVSSAKIVSIARSLLNLKKNGHGGTLDPLATGVLPIAIGEATKTVSFINDDIKEYEFILNFGKETTSYDEEGDVVRENNFFPTKEEFTNILKDFIGNIKQRPPIFSAIWVNGKRAYELARSGDEFELEARDVFIKSIEILDFCTNDKSVKLFVECGKGTYIRSLGHDLAKKTGGIGYITGLRRTKVGNFNKKNLISLEKLEKIVHNGELDDHLLSVDSVLDDIPAIFFSEDDAKKLLNGVKIEIKESIEQKSEVFLAKNGEKLLAIGKITKSYFVPMRIFNFNKECYDVDY